MRATRTVRPFEVSDAGPLTELLHSAYAELGAMGLNFTAVDQDATTTLARATSGHCWVVEEDGRVIATLTMSLPPSPGLQQLTERAREPNRAWMNQVAVSLDARGAGLASLLWKTGREWAAGAGATSIGLDTAIPAHHLVELYAAWGFTAADTVHWPGKTYNSVIMIRSL